MLIKMNYHLEHLLKLVVSRYACFRNSANVKQLKLSCAHIYLFNLSPPFPPLLLVITLALFSWLSFVCLMQGMQYSFYLSSFMFLIFLFGYSVIHLW